MQKHGKRLQRFKSVEGTCIGPGVVQMTYLICYDTIFVISYERRLLFAVTNKNKAKTAKSSEMHGTTGRW